VLHDALQDDLELLGGEEDALDVIVVGL